MFTALIFTLAVSANPADHFDNQQPITQAKIVLTAVDRNQIDVAKQLLQRLPDARRQTVMTEMLRLREVQRLNRIHAESQARVAQVQRRDEYRQIIREQEAKKARLQAMIVQRDKSRAKAEIERKKREQEERIAAQRARDRARMQASLDQMNNNLRQLQTQQTLRGGGYWGGVRRGNSLGGR